MRIPVFLSCYRLFDRTGTEVTIRERRLTPRGPQDKVIAEIEGPPGTRIRRKADQHGPDQLIVPLSRGVWSRLRGDYIAIPAKYVIGHAKSGAYGLSLVRMVTEAEASL